MQPYYDKDTDEEFSDNTSVEGINYRPQTAPPSPITELEEFKRFLIQSYYRQREFYILEKAQHYQNQLIQRDFHKYDLDNPEGQRSCKKYLKTLEEMCIIYQVKTLSRDYRNTFSKAYKILYKEDRLCYLPEILDSAQEGFPYLWVNSEKFVFSPDVLSKGSKLIELFYKVQHVIRLSFSRTLKESPEFSSKLLKQDIIRILEDFDQIWVDFEKLYVKELMDIEAKARRFILLAIEIDKEMTSIEIREKLRGKILVTSENYIQKKEQFCKVIAQINTVANVEGKGRDDLGINILLEAEGITRRVTKEQSSAVRNLADSIKANFQKFREQMRKYEGNIEMVDPQLKNNQELVDLLVEYESQWEKGLYYLLDPTKCQQLMYFSHIIETTAEKYQQFQEQLECRDSDIFVTIPCLIALKYLENEDRNICTYFLPKLKEETSKLYQQYAQLKNEFLEWRNLHTKQYEYYNILEKQLLGIPLNEKEQIALQNFKLDNIMQKIRQMSIELQRYNAIEWNYFIDAAINNN
ncbi:unnamed protein product [Paramecium pentaurelia]|uniref:Uncharacterized protein n=1 Tax=Paramecium pentaurelia TaxID=43138 RepID=A0A8S1SBT7_9CILI|nr:unnamed protein product [Paramecium pentaurelia]